MSESVSSNCLLSHPSRSLREHLLTVAKSCKHLIESKVLNISDLPSDLLNNVVYLIGLCHDFGKATHYFQLYIREEDEQARNILRSSGKTNHGLLSAVFCYYVLEKYINTLEMSNIITSFLPILGYTIVKRHHGNLKNITTEILALSDDEVRETLLDQLGSMDMDEINHIINEGLVNTALIKINLDDFRKCSSFICNELLLKAVNPLVQRLRHLNDLRFYFLHHLFYSILLDSDKNDAIFHRDIKTDRVQFRTDIVDMYRGYRGYDLTTDEFNILRNNLYKSVTLNIIERDKILSLNAPTGSGKTLTALSFALKLRDKIKQREGVLPRIIYCLPFLSIIDQNFGVFSNLLSETLNFTEIPTSLLLEHHHLSDLSYQDQDEEFNANESEFLIEGWNSEIVVTTFVQLFQSIVTNRNRAVRKFHNIVNSIALLDEVQSIPHKYWGFIKRVIKTFSNLFNVRFIFMTATLPLIFDRENNEITELLPNHEAFFQQLNRVSLHLFIENVIELEDFKRLVGEQIVRHPDKDFLIVLNTINCCREVFIYLQSLNPINTNIYYLSTHIIPRERLQRIEQIKNDTQRKIIVSTQLIEAGVDINVDITYRDLSPLDSINQVAGRCNRNNTNVDKGEVYIYRIGENGEEFFKYIYDLFLVDKTLETLQSRNIVQEEEFLSLHNAYFQKVHQFHSTNTSKELLEDLSQLRFDDLTRKFRLIEDNFSKINVFIEYDNRASELWQQFQALRQIADPFERRGAFLEMRGEFYSYVISVSKKYSYLFSRANRRIYYLSQFELFTYYSPEIGFHLNLEV